MSNNLCPLCHAEDKSLFCKHETGVYFQCKQCSLVFVEEASRLQEKDEKERYDLHTNSPDDEGYRNYLQKVLRPVVQRIEESACGLDFGSGPGPTLHKMFEEVGYSMHIYDHFYAYDPAVLERSYDFITSTEVVEHLYDPLAVLDMLFSMLRHNGILTILTQPYVNQEKFATWYYKNDPTHVCFFSLSTMQWLAKKWKASLECVGNDIFIFKRVEDGN